MPFVTRIKELIHEGCVGDILSVHFEWMLDTEHGADYFRRWHRKKENSGGLLVHKATHHFDMVNWLIDDEAGKGERIRHKKDFTVRSGKIGERDASPADIKSSANSILIFKRPL